MTRGELFRYDIRGYMIIKNAIEPASLRLLNEGLDRWEEKAFETYKALPEEANKDVRYNDILNQEPALLELAANEKLIPYLVEMIERPRLKSTWLTFRWKGGRTGYHSNHTPSVLPFQRADLAQSDEGDVRDAGYWAWCGRTAGGSGQSQGELCHTRA